MLYLGLLAVSIDMYERTMHDFSLVWFSLVLVSFITFFEMFISDNWDLIYFEET